MAFIRKIKGSLVKMVRTEYVGEDTYLFYDIDTGCLYRSNGTPGGEPICGGGSGPGGSGGVESYPTAGDFPIPGQPDTIYIALDNDLIYHWDGSHYVPLISQGADDNVEEYPNVASFPATGVPEVLYIDAENDVLYYWDGTMYVSIGQGPDIATAVIPPATSAALYTAVAPTANLSLKFILSVTNSAGDFATAEVLGSYKNADNSVSHTHYALLGDNILYRPDLVYAGPDVQLNIVNNEGTPITAQVTRVPTRQV